MRIDYGIIILRVIMGSAILFSVGVLIVGIVLAAIYSWPWSLGLLPLLIAGYFMGEKMLRGTLCE